MKKIIAFFVLVLVCVSCIDENVLTPIITHKDGKLTRETFDQIIEFDYEGHEYIWFRSLNGGYAGWDGGIVHNPDCKKCKTSDS